MSGELSRVRSRRDRRDEELVAPLVGVVGGVWRLRLELGLVATLTGARSRAERLTVPVARDAHGGLVVNDLPSLASAPRRADVGPSSGASMLGDDRSAISDVLTRFLTAFVAGDRAGLVYLTPPDTRIVADLSSSMSPHQ